MIALATSAAEPATEAARPVPVTGDQSAKPEAVCAVPGAILPSRATLTNQPASTRRMVQRLEEVLRTTEPQEGAFMSAEMAEMYRLLLGNATNLKQVLQIKPVYAQQLLQAGQSEAAFKEFEDYERLLRENGIPLSSRLIPMLMTSKAMCQLRLGEQENCLLNHSAESCLVPIRGEGIHKLQRGSRGRSRF